MNEIVGSHDILFVTLDTLRYDVALECIETGRTPNLAALLPGGRWEKRHTSGSFTYSAHQAFFAGFLPTPVSPGPHSRLLAARFPGSETTGPETFVYDAPTLVEGLRDAGYHTVCIGGVGFFNNLTALGRALPGMFDESHWSVEMGVTSACSTEQQVELSCRIARNLPSSKRLLLFINVSAIHQPNCIFQPGATCDSPATQAAALAYVDRCLPPLFDALQNRSPTFCIVCSDHGTAYGEEGYHGHRLSHPVVWTVPYGEFVLSRGDGGRFMMIATEPLFAASPFVAYSYSYPHKSAYRHFDRARPLNVVWQNEQRSSLFLYMHVPFCEYRCGFCNLFTLANADAGLPAKYVQQVRREAQAVRAALPDAEFTRIAIGGGTPTFLDERELVELLDVVQTVIDGRPHAVPVSCEASPATLTLAKGRLLRDWGVDRLSLGVQTFDDAESRRLGRPQCTNEVREAIRVAREMGFPTLNLDLIYGAPQQTLGSWSRSVEHAIEYEPEEIYLYPLYVRDLTGLGRLAAVPSDNRLEAYRLGRRILINAGYEQVSLRMFRRPAATSESAPVYCCQSDGMVGLGCGARSYTRELHYSTEFAVGRTGVRSILAEYLNRESDTFQHASYGYELDDEDQRRRHIILSLLQVKGLDRHEYSARFGSDVLDDLPQLWELVEGELALVNGERICLTSSGIEKSDAIGPWLYSKKVLRLMEEFECR